MTVKIYLGTNGNDEVELEDDEELSLHPTCTSVGGVFDIAKKAAYRVEYWQGIERTQQYVHYDKIHIPTKKKDAKIAADELYAKMNKNTKKSVITIKAKQLTPFVLKHFRFVQSEIEYPAHKISFPPRLCGLWIGDGTSCTAEVTTMDDKIVDYLKEIAIEHDIPLVVHKEITYTFRSFLDGKRNKNFVKDQLRELDLLNNKHVPRIYMENSREVRLEILAGLIDSDGYKDRYRIEIYQKSDRITADIIELAKSLGIFAVKSVKLACATNTEAKTMYPYNRIVLYPRNISIPVLLTHKIIDINNDKKVHGIKISITKTIARNVWTDEMKQIMFDCAKNDDYKKGSRINWTKIKADHKCFDTMTADAIRAMYTKLKKK